MAVDSLIVPISSFLSLSFTIFVLRHEGINFYLYVLPTAAATIIQPAQQVPGTNFGVFADAQGHKVGVASNG